MQAIDTKVFALIALATLVVVELQDGEQKYAGVDGLYRLHIWDARTFS